MAKVISKKPNATAGDQDAPRKIEVIFSTTPRKIAAIRAPGRLPIPPSTQIARMRPMNSRPVPGWIG